MRKDATSTPIQVRVRLADLATITEFVRSTGVHSDVASQILADGVRAFAEMVRWNKLGSSYDFNQAVDYLDGLGVFKSLRVNKKAFSEQIGRVKVSRLPDKVSPEEFQKILKKFEELQNGQTGVSTNDCTVPAQDDELLSALEQGKPQVEHSSTRGLITKEGE